MLICIARLSRCNTILHKSPFVSFIPGCVWSLGRSQPKFCGLADRTAICGTRMEIKKASRELNDIPVWTRRLPAPTQAESEMTGHHLSEILLYLARPRRKQRLVTRVSGLVRVLSVDSDQPLIDSSQYSFFAIKPTRSLLSS
jgi:hypothetical protein